MQTLLFIRPLTAAERDALEAGLRLAEALTVRRCQMRLASAEGQPSPTMARHRRCHDQTVPHAMHAFHQRGMSALYPTSSRPHRPKAIFDTKRQERLRALLHQSPRLYGRSTSVWTLALAAEVSDAQGQTNRRARSVARRFVWPSSAEGYAGSGPNTGSLAPIPPPSEKTGATA